LDVSTTNSPVFDEDVVVVVEVEVVEVLVSGVVTGLFVGAAVVWLVGSEVPGVGSLQQLPF
jgi:hypothetical protein